MAARNEILYRALRARIALRYAVGDKLPSISEIQNEYGIPSATTVRQAQQRLVEDGILETRQGLGAYVVRVPQSPNVDLTAELTRLHGEIAVLIEATRTSSRTVTYDFNDPDRPHTYYVLTAALSLWADRTRAEAATGPANAEELRALADFADELRSWAEPALLPVRNAATTIAAEEPAATAQERGSGLYASPDDAERDDLRRRLVARAWKVREEGWEAYQLVWSAGEVAGIALILEDRPILAAAGESESTVLRRYAYDLFGVHGGQREEADGFPETYEWFEHARADLKGRRA
ncbi:winged helix-turn-helix domain-containing protein [Nocardia sp. NPDC052001]|uniref:winged helix-turn-helix domain-containing protein n=1 Tax=Nocardia sp. NPDC052001 TaxID=3154853 RepID=UPI003417EAC5